VKLFINTSAPDDLFLNKQQKSLNDNPFFLAPAKSLIGEKNSSSLIGSSNSVIIFSNTRT